MTTTCAARPIHPAAMMFPLMEGKPFEEFREDIRKNGLLQPIAVLPDGSVIDGRNRLRACRELGIEPQFVTVDPESPLAYALSANKHRRHLSSGQLAALGAEEMLSKLQEEAKERKREGGRRSGVTRRGEDRKQVSHLPDSGRSDEHTAKLFGTNKQYVQRARRLKRDAPDLFERVKAGSMELADAMRERVKRNASCERPVKQLPSTATGKRAAIMANAAKERAAEFVARIEGVAAYCDKVSIMAIRSDERLRRNWLEACKSARRALAGLLKQLEEK